ncbi:hypothetical protein N473_18160 [Pseudoalteromonas luteoviolacea CPMOR-1]|uniref:Uncharacterized protein n=1 Tax=Pseudoalteromonas luteoviolacea CPMOR-1 TaxID=1365248 RepID=A0A167KIB1_9GAMM|nr:hypothetical protein N473_18160 [Pseudoalteromonas luteoviolacea CPMOR-1]
MLVSNLPFLNRVGMEPNSNIATLYKCAIIGKPVFNFLCHGGFLIALFFQSV